METSCKVVKKAKIKLEDIGEVVLQDAGEDAWEESSAPKGPIK